MLTEHVYLGRDNPIDLVLQDDSGGSYAAVDLATVTRVVAELTRVKTGDEVLVDSAESPDAFDWSAGNGKLSLRFGAEEIPAGTYRARLVLYDAAGGWDDGLVWVDGDDLRLEVHS